MKKTSLISTVLKGLLFASAAFIAAPHLALAAGTDLNAVAGTADTELSSIPTIIAVCFYIGGAAFTGSGLLKLKQYADNPNNVKLGEGVGRLSVGAGLLVLPYISTALINSLGLTGTGAPTFESFNQTF